MDTKRPSPVAPDSALATECDVLCRYLAGRTASTFVAQKYAEAHARDARYGSATALDRILMRIAGSSPALAQWVDSYASIAARKSLLRKKLILLMAILESSSPEHGFDEQIHDTPAGAVIARMALRGLLHGMRFALGLLILGPIHFVCAVSGGARERP